MWFMTEKVIRRSELAVLATYTASNVSKTCHMQTYNGLL